MKTARLFILLLAFAGLLSDVSWVRAQQADDDPNWREREIERLLEESQKLHERLEALNKEFEALKGQLERRRNKSFGQLLNQALQNTRRSIWLNREDYGPRLPKHRI
jgi:uncharacterized protein with von Willebrand factor type A (vWA) domain